MEVNATSIEQQHASLAEADQTPGAGLLKDASFPQDSINATWIYDGPEDDYRYHNDVGGVGTYASFGARVRIWQAFDLSEIVDPLPADPLEYGVGCQYGFDGFSQCTLRVYQLDGSQETLLEERLLQGVQGERGAEREDPENPNVTWHTLVFKPVENSRGVRRVRIEFETPDRLGTPWLYLRAVHVSLILPAFNGENALNLVVDPGGLNYPQSAPPFKLCHGAAHALSVTAPAGDAWVGQKFCLAWRQTGEVPAEYGLSAVPEFNSNESAEDRYYQRMPATGPVQWTLQGMDNHSIKSGDVMLGLGSYWHAPVVPVPVTVGDFHHKLAQLQWDGVIPIVELNNKARLTATVINPFATARLPVGVAVVWLLNGVEYRRTLTDDQGRAVLEYQPEVEDIGESNTVEFTARCLDEFNFSSEIALKLPVYLKTPWLEEMDVLLDDEPITEFEKAGVFLTRGAAHILTLKPKRADSFFIGKQTALRWPASGPQLGIEFTPVGEREMDAQGLAWRLEGGDTSGFFDIDAMLAEIEVPLTLKGLQLSQNLTDEADVMLDEELLAPGSAIIFRKDASRRLVLRAKAESPLSQLGADAWLTFDPGSLTEDQMLATPGFGSKRELLADGLAWSLIGTQDTGNFGLRFHVQFKQLEMSLKCLLIATTLADDVMLALDWIAIKPDVSQVLRRKTAHTLSLLPVHGSPLAGSGLQVWLTFEPGSLTDDKITAQPAYGVRRELAASWLSWSLAGEDLSGTFTLNVHVQGCSEPIVRFPDCMLLSLNVNDELALRRGDDDPLQVFYSNHTEVISLEPKRDSPLYGRGPKGILSFVETGGLRKPDVSASPTYDQLTRGQAQWRLTPNHFIGGFGLEATAPGFTQPAKLDCVVASRDFLSTFYSSFNGLSMGIGSPHTFLYQEPNRLRIGVKYFPEMDPLPASIWLELVDEDLISGTVTSVPSFGVKRALQGQRLEWSLTYSGPRPAEFSIRFCSDIPEASRVYRFRVSGAE